MCLPGTVETVRRRADAEGIRFDRRTALVGAAGAAVAAAFPAVSRAATKGGNRIQSLTHVFRPDFPLFLGAPAINEREVLVTVPVNGFYANRWNFWEHSCTHFDVPAHFVEGGRTSDQMSFAELVRPLAVIDISARAAQDPDAVVELADVVAFERRHGRILRGSFVAMYSGWETRANDEDAFRNVGADGVQHFPGFGLDAVQFLLAERRAAGVGVDTLSLDHGPSQTFDVHFAVLGADRYGIENLANLSTVPPRGATIHAALIPWQEGSGGPGAVYATW